MAEEEAGSPVPQEELGEHRQLLAEGEGEEEAHMLEVEEGVEEVGLLFLVVEGAEEEVEQGPQAEEEEGVGVEQGHQEAEEVGVEPCNQGVEEEEVGVEELLNQEVMAVEVEELALSLLEMVEREVEEVGEAAADMNTGSHSVWVEAARSRSLHPAHHKAL